MKNPTRIRRFCNAVLFSVAVLLGVECIAQNTSPGLSTSQDCAGIASQVPGGGLLTQEEKIALYDKAILESLGNFEPCQSTKPGGYATGSPAGAGVVVKSTPPAIFRVIYPPLKSPTDMPT